MSFFSDKDFKKGAGPQQKKTSTSSGIKTKVDDTKKIDNVVERARTEREERAKVRETTSFVIKLQSWWRGRSTSNRTIKALRAAFDSKVNDIENLSALLLSKNNIVFIPPVPICMELAVKLTAFGLHGVEVLLLLDSITMINITFNTSDHTYNGIIQSSPYQNTPSVLLDSITDTIIFLSDWNYV